jgi:hypothetical protein
MGRGNRCLAVVKGVPCCRMGCEILPRKVVGLISPKALRLDLLRVSILNREHIAREICWIPTTAPQKSFEIFQEHRAVPRRAAQLVLFI